MILALMLMVQNPVDDLRDAADQMEKSTDMLHRAGRPPKPDDVRKGMAGGCLDEAIQRQKSALESLDAILEALKKNGN